MGCSDFPSLLLCLLGHHSGPWSQALSPLTLRTVGLRRGSKFDQRPLWTPRPPVAPSLMPGCPLLSGQAWWPFRPQDPEPPPSHVPAPLFLCPTLGPRKRGQLLRVLSAANTNPESRIAGMRPYKASGDGKPHQSRAWERAGVRLGFFLFVFETHTPELNIFPHRLPRQSFANLSVL